MVDEETGRVVEGENKGRGYELSSGKYVEIEPEELKALRLATATTMQIKQFVKAEEVSAALYERPYFVAPKDEAQAKALGIMRKAMAETGTMGIGEIAFSGREHLVAIGAPLDPKQKGLMLYTLRYEEELRAAKGVVGDVKEGAVASEELSLAKRLIDGSTSKFDLSKYKNDYIAAVKKLVEAKRKGRKIEVEEPAPKPEKVVSIMDALRKSLGAEKPVKRTKKAAAKKQAAA